MPDNLTFPIGFDLESAVRQAQGDADRLLRKLETTIKSRPLGVDIQISAGDGSINSINKKLDECIKKWNALSEAERITNRTSGEFTDQAKAIIAEFVQLTGATESYARSLSQLRAAAKRASAAQEKNVEKETKRNKIIHASEKQIKSVADKLRYYKDEMNRSDVGSAQFLRAAEEVKRLTMRLEELELKAAKATGTLKKKTESVTNEFRRQDGYVSRLIKRLVVYSGFQMIGNFLTKVREVTAEFELQRVSLGAILQDQQKANALFSEIKQFALKSPVSILDLTKYTKQLAAYKIGYDELFETTKRLTDVSVGLGVSMDRVVLAYGQVRATGHLRASEIRQFTEMGVPIVEELAAKLTELNGKLVTTAEVMGMVSKRGISFEMVKEVFEDMTSAGGIFYNMQEKQGNTLYGLWAKLGDAASVMYEQIGNTGIVNSTMKLMIEGTTSAMRNWESYTFALLTAGGALGLLFLKSKLQGMMLKGEAQATVAVSAARDRLTEAQKNNARATTMAAEASLRAALLNKKATAATNMWTFATLKLRAAFESLKASMIKNWVMLLVTVVIEACVWLRKLYVDAHAVENIIGDIKAETDMLREQGVRNFESLANAAVNAANGSMAQKRALDELKRTYRDVIPQEQLTINNLRKMQGHYDKLTRAIQDNIAVQQQQKGLDELQNEIGPKLTSDLSKIREAMGSRSILQGTLWLGAFGDTRKIFNEQEIDAVMGAFERVCNNAGDRALTAKEKLRKAFSLANVEASDDDIASVFDRATSFGRHSAVTNYANNAISLMDGAAKITNVWSQAYREYGLYATELQNLENRIQNSQVAVTEGVSRFEVSQKNANNAIKAMGQSIKNLLRGSGFLYLSLSDELDENGNIVSRIDFDKMFEDLRSSPSTPPALIKTLENIQQQYEQLIPSDDTVVMVRDKFQAIAQSVDAPMEQMTQYLMQPGQNLKEYNKILKDQLKVSKQIVSDYEFRNRQIENGVGAGIYTQVSEQDLENARAEVKTLEQMIQWLGIIDKSQHSSDPRLGILQEITSSLKNMRKEYESLRKTEGDSRAFDEMKRRYTATLANIRELSRRHNFNLPDFGVPRNMEELADALGHVRQAIEALPSGTSGKDKALLAFDVDLDKLNSEDLRKKVEEGIKALADKISRTKTAQEFYQRILNITGDIELAGRVSMSIYGSTGAQLKRQLVEQLRGLTNNIDLPEGIISADNLINYRKLRDFAERNKDELGDTYDELVRIAVAGQSDLAKTYEGYLKDLEKAKTYSDKRIELARYTANMIAEIEASTLPDEEKKMLTAGYQERETQKQGELEWEAFKDMPMYVQMFDDLDNASVRTLTNMKQRLSELESVWGSTLNPTQLKELQSRMSEIDAQLARKNPFRTLSDSIKEYKELRLTYGSEDKLGKEIKAASEAYDEAKKELAEQLEKNPQDAEAIESLQKRVDLSEDELKQLQKIADAYKKVKDVIGLSLGEVFKIAGGLGDLASGIGKITGVFGGSEEDVQYWDDIANGLNDVTSGIENMVQAALSGNPIGIATAAVTAIPNMISGFATLFYAGRIKRANKEIKRQQELIEQLQYSYSMVEKYADKVFGVDYLNNYNQQMELLEAQQTAYLKQAEAERSKGKKADQERIKEFEEQARDTANKIKELESDLVSRFVGAERSSLAADFANAWIDAKLSFANTADAIKGKYAEMVKSMIVQGAAAKIIDQILAPMWDKMGEYLKDNDVDGAIDYIAESMDGFINAADQGLQSLWSQLEARGIDLSRLLGDDSNLKGTSRNIASASEEDINGLAAATNTQNAYISMILDEVRGIRHDSGGNSQPVDWNAITSQSLLHLGGIERNTAEAVIECRKSAEACMDIANRLGRVTDSAGGRSAFRVRMN